MAAVARSMPSTMIAPDAPPSTCFELNPWMCGWYQYMPGGSLAGTRNRYSKRGSPGWIDVRSTSSWWQIAGMVMPWKCRFVDSSDICPLLQGSTAAPRRAGACVVSAIAMRGDDAAAASTGVASFFKPRITRSPGCTRSVGDCAPSGVT